MRLVPIMSVGFAFAGPWPKDDLILPNDLVPYAYCWCFRISCLDCNLNCKYCYNKLRFNQDKIHINPYFVSQVRRHSSVNTFVYSVGEPGLFTNEIAKVIQQYPSDQFRHCIKTNGTFMEDELVEEIYAINTDIKGNSIFYNQITQQTGFFEDVLEQHLQWLSDISIPVKELTYSVWLWHNDDEETRQLVLKYVDQINATLCLNFIKSHRYFDAGYQWDLNNEKIYERVYDIYLWFKDYGIEPFIGFRLFDPNK